MKPISHDKLEVGMIVVMTKAGPKFLGLKDRMLKVLAIDEPYIVLQLPSIGTYMMDASEAVFAIPEKETIIAMLPEYVLDAEVIEG